MGQYLGAFLAAMMVFGTYSDAIYHYDPVYTVPGANYTDKDIPKDFPMENILENGLFFAEVPNGRSCYYGDYYVCDYNSQTGQESQDSQDTKYRSNTPTAGIFATYPHSTGEKYTHDPDVEPYERISIGICV